MLNPNGPGYCGTETVPADRRKLPQGGSGTAPPRLVPGHKRDAERVTDFYQALRSKRIPPETAERLTLAWLEASAALRLANLKLTAKG